MKFTGFCTYPHGGYASAGLFLASTAALLATTFGVASCQMFVLTYTSDQGSFEEYFDIFGRSDTSNVATRYKVGIGLFQWLNPFDDDNFADGYCQGYQETMLDRISDPTFEAARGFAVFAVVLGIVVTLWCLLSACLSSNRMQMFLFRACLVCGTIATGLTFLMNRASLCKTEFSERSCELDEGGLLLVAAVILWLTAFLVSVIFIRSSTFYMRDAFAAEDDKLRLSDEVASRRSAQQSRPRSTRSSQRSLDSIESFRRAPKRVTIDDVSRKGDLEVYISKKLNNIDNLVDV